MDGDREKVEIAMMVRWLRQQVKRWRVNRHAPPEWPVPERAAPPRVLLEYPSFATPSVAADLLRRAGCEPLICEGPGDMVGVCRLLETGECPAARDADVIFNAFGLGTREHRAIIDALRRRYPDTPVVVETTRPRAKEHPDLLDGRIRCDAPVTSRRMLDAVATALESR